MPTNADLAVTPLLRWRLLWAVPPVLLAVPLLLDWRWTGSDYIFAIALIAIVGGLIELAAWISPNRYYRAGAALATLATFALVWVNAAVGILGDEGNPANLLFLGVIAIAAMGALLSGFKAWGTSRAMAAAAIAQATVCIGGFAAELGTPGWQGLYEAALCVVLFVPLWVGAAWAFARAASSPAP